MKLLGIDTSNYTTSCAWYDTDTDRIIQKKMLDIFSVRVDTLFLSP